MGTPPVMPPSHWMPPLSWGAHLVDVRPYGCFIFLVNATTDESCTAIPESERVDCGWSGITQQECETNLCCFDSSTNGVPHCYFKASKFHEHVLLLKP